MKQLKDRVNNFTRYDLKQEVPQVFVDEFLQQVTTCVIKGDDEKIEEVVKKALGLRSVLEVINEGLIAGMNEVSHLWDKGTYFLPQVILSSEAMSIGIATCEEKMGKALPKKAKVVTHTAEGDIHDLGQMIVNVLLAANGFEVINLGADVPVSEVVEACKVHKPLMVTGTALMTTTIAAFPKIAAKLKEQNLNIPFVCGGAVSKEFVTSFDLGIWGKEASQAPEMAEYALKGATWADIRTRWNG
jgi:methanol corrinoid protein